MTNDKFSADPTKLTTFLGQHFEPALRWESHLHQIGDRRFGILYVHEEQKKPVLSVASSDGNYREGEIMYRYAGMSRTIKYAELVGLIEGRIQQERFHWQNMLSRLATLRPDEAWLLDAKEGTLEGGTHTLVVEPELLERIQWIKKGSFTEAEGEPTLKVIGEVQTATGKPVIATKILPRAITRDSILSAFFSESADDPSEYLKALPYENTHWMPLWFFARAAGLTADEVKALFLSCKNATKTTKKRLVERLASDSIESLRSYKLPRVTDVPAFNNEAGFEKAFSDWAGGLPKTYRLPGLRRAAVFQALQHGGLQWSEDFWQSWLDPLLQALTLLERQDLVDERARVMTLLRGILEMEPTGPSATLFRKTICAVDFAIFGPSGD